MGVLGLLASCRGSSSSWVTHVQAHRKATKDPAQCHRRNDDGRLFAAGFASRSSGSKSCTAASRAAKILDRALFLGRGGGWMDVGEGQTHILMLTGIERVEQRHNC